MTTPDTHPRRARRHAPTPYARCKYSVRQLNRICCVQPRQAAPPDEYSRSAYSRVNPTPWAARPRGTPTHWLPVKTAELHGEIKQGQWRAKAAGCAWRRCRALTGPPDGDPGTQLACRSCRRALAPRRRRTAQRASATRQRTPARAMATLAEKPWFTDAQLDPGQVIAQRCRDLRVATCTAIGHWLQPGTIGCFCGMGGGARLIARFHHPTRPGSV